MGEPEPPQNPHHSPKTKLAGWAKSTPNRYAKSEAQRPDFCHQQAPNSATPNLNLKLSRLAEEVGVSKSTVQRILAHAKLRPHRLDRYLASNDPEFESKAADIIGLYLNPPQDAAVFCVDEKTAIQALDRLDPVLPMSPDTDLNIIATARYRCMQP